MLLMRSHISQVAFSDPPELLAGSCSLSEMTSDGATDDDEPGDAAKISGELGGRTGEDGEAGWNTDGL